jgi:hypothetical protein
MKNAWILLGLSLAAACAPAAPDTEATTSEVADTVVADATTAGAPSSAADSATSRNDAGFTQVASVPRSAVFPHTPHRDVACTTCHGAIRGHATHTTIACRECHASAPAGSTPRAMTKAECLGCHHGAQQRVSCTTCHAPVAPRSVTRTFQLSVWDAPRATTLPFDHARHVSVTCASCHQTPPFLPPDRACGSCHERHHRPDAVCASCHAAPPAGVHDVRVHASCSGSGCHAASVVADLPRSRQECSVCHRDRADHYPDRDCAPCHRLGSSSGDER